MNEKTRICCLNVEQDVIAYLRGMEFDVYDGGFGPKIRVGEHNKSNYYSCLLLHPNFPENMHEYEVFIVDMANVKEMPYFEKDHICRNVSSGKAMYFYSSSPSTIFNPVPYESQYFRSKLIQHIKRPRIKIIFQAKKEVVEYKFGESHNYPEKSKHCNYELSANFALGDLYGEDVVLAENDLSKMIFQNCLKDVKYCQTFNNREDKDYVPLLKSTTGDVVSYLYCSDVEIVFMLPQLSNKVQIIKTLLNDVFFKELSEYFPHNTYGKWRDNAQYFLPNHQMLIEKKEKIKKEYDEKLQLIDEQIKKNEEEYSFLHDLIIESGDKLVNATIKFLRWLGFENVIDKDTTAKNGLLEEDIQVDMGEDGLLVIEVKGINGTSTDSECSQIHKIVHRRGKERGKYDVKGLYIVNNERNVEPLKRTMPPFDSTKIQDAVNDERGLAYTWQLFNLYYNIENGFITKDEARRRLLNPGLVDFTPNFQNIGTPYNILKKGFVICIELKGLLIEKGDIVAFESKGRYEKKTIICIQQEHKEVQRCDTGKVGIEVDKAISNVKELYLVK